ncbi:MAG: hypothetical protein Q8R33_09530 [Burkholderiales bacterium]|nr:hypothetical protein [Burkholderiales bacterium]
MRFDPFDEYLKYLDGIAFDKLLQDADYRAASKMVHKRVLALLVLEFQIDVSIRQGQVGNLERDSAPFLSEFRSDLLSTMLIFQIGLYKAASMSARSALENLFRVIAGLQGLDFRPLDSVFELVELVKQSPARTTYSQFDQELGVLIDKYGALCKYVHSAGEEFMSLDRKLGEIPRWTKDDGEALAANFVRMVQSAMSLLIYLRVSALRELRHDQRDIVLDALSNTTKGVLTRDLGLL